MALMEKSCVSASWGDDYELCFCVDEAKRAMVEAIGLELQLPLTQMDASASPRGCGFTAFQRVF